MATVKLAYDHARDPVNETQLASLIQTALALSSLPDVQVNNTEIVVTHPNVTSANAAAIQTVIGGYVLDPVWSTAPAGNAGVLFVKALTAIQTNIDALNLPDPTPGNNTFLAIGSPTNAQVLAQVRALTNQMNAMYAQSVALTRQNTTLLRWIAGRVDAVTGT